MSLDIRKKELEINRVRLAQMELEYKIEEKLEEVQRLQSHVEIQKQSLIKLEQEIKQLKGE